MALTREMDEAVQVEQNSLGLGNSAVQSCHMDLLVLLAAHNHIPRTKPAQQFIINHYWSIIPAYPCILYWPPII